MAMTPDADDSKVASHTLAYLRLLDKKIDVVIDAFQRHGERLARVERDQGETRAPCCACKQSAQPGLEGAP